jgi:hypothetical protein
MGAHKAPCRAPIVPAAFVLSVVLLLLFFFFFRIPSAVMVSLFGLSADRGVSCPSGQVAAPAVVWPGEIVACYIKRSVTV